MDKYEVISEEEGTRYGFGAFAVTVVPHLMVSASDGIKLAVKLWFPSSTLEGNIGSLVDLPHYTIYRTANAAGAMKPAPVVMEYIPYRKSDGTLSRDHRRLTWLCSHGYVCARVDMRGSGDSEGLYYGEYLPQACMGLRYLATGASLSLLVDVQGKCCKATLSTNINRFLEYLACMSASNVKFPETEEELFEAEQKCAQRYGLSGCIGFTDGTYVPMMQPVVNEKVFYCRKHYHALNVMEQKDACDMIGWLADQPWCNGNVGMYGKSWSGFNGLQVAYEKPPALKAVISLYSTDDRYASDIHYMGGSILASQALWWGSYMQALNAAPPHPALTPAWKDLWRKRLEEASEPWVHDWFSHQARGSFWKQGSVCEDVSRLADCAILMIGGWNDSYHDAVFRGVASFPNVRGIIGPWCHDWPDVGAPGPAIAFTDECLKWWDCHLKGVKNGAMDVPLLRAYMQDSFSPEPDVFVDRAGEWVADSEWPPKATNRWLYLIPDNASGTLYRSEDAGDIRHSTNDLHSDNCASHGLACGEWWYISTTALPGDQRTEDAQAMCWTTPELKEDIRILGFPIVELEVSISGCNTANIAVRLCDVFPDGRSNLLTWGMLNMAHRDGHDPSEVKPLVQGEVYKIKVTCLSTGYVVPRGHKLRLAVAPNYWPHMWPAKAPVNMTVATGLNTQAASTGATKVFHSQLILPIRPVELDTVQEVKRFPEFLPPRVDHAELPTDVLRTASYRRHVEQDISSNKQVFVVSEDSGKRVLHQTDVTTGSKFEARYTMKNRKDPLSAAIDINYNKEFEYPNVEGGVFTTIDTYSHMTADEEKFHFVHKLDVKISGESFFTKKWVKDVPRFYN